VFSAWSLRNLLDTNLRVTEPGLSVYLRVANDTVDDTDPNDEFASYGFQICVTGASLTGAMIPGYGDYLIDPPASVHPLSYRDIGLLGGKLFFGAHSFLISHTWVQSRMALLGLTDPYEVFRAKSVTGLIYNQRLFSIESVTSNDSYGEIISWNVLGNMLEDISQTAPLCVC